MPEGTNSCPLCAGGTPAEAAARGDAAEEKYLYAIVPSSAVPDGQEGRPYECCGFDGGSVYAIMDGRVAAVVSDAPEAKVRPDRRRIRAHHAVLKHLMSRGAVLPVCFGTIAQSARALREVLRANEPAFHRQLVLLAHKVEMGLRVLWDVPNIYEYFLSTHPRLRSERDRIFRADRAPSQEDKIELGRLFDQLLKDERAAHTDRVLGVLGPLCCETKLNKPRGEAEVMNLACLVREDRQKEFEQGVFEAARLFDDNFRFDFSGPFAPYSFVDADLSLGRALR